MSISGISSTPSISYPQPAPATSQAGTQAQSNTTSQTLAAQQTASIQPVRIDRRVCGRAQTQQQRDLSGGRRLAAKSEPLMQLDKLPSQCGSGQSTPL